MNAVQRLVYWLFIASSGGATRRRIFNGLRSEPANANQLAKRFTLDYKTVRHHLKMLQKNNMVETMGSGYNVMFFPSTLAEENTETIDQLLQKYAPEGE